MFKLAIGLVVAVFIGIGCRWFGIPLPGPPAITGAAMAVAMASGYTWTDYMLTRHRTVPPAAANPAATVMHIAPVNDPTEQLSATRQGLTPSSR